MSESERKNASFRLRSPITDKRQLSLDESALRDYLCSKYGPVKNFGPSPRLRYERGFVSADDMYEAMISKLVDENTRWLDVGCGRDIFPSNYEGARKLAQRAEFLAGVDPDPNVYENALLSIPFQGTIEDYDTTMKFNLITMRMVAEHVVNAEKCVQKLANLTSPGGLVVIYTPWKWAPLSVIASIVPFAWHNPLKRLVWETEERDTFPTAYKMNTRSDLEKLFVREGFEEYFFLRLDDCSIFTRYLWLNKIEIFFRNLFLRFGLVYPEHCLLAVLKKGQ